MERARLIQGIINMQHGIAPGMKRHDFEPWIDLNLTIGQLKSLFFINAVGSTNVRNLADVLGRTSSEVTRIIDRLVAQGLVSRQENPEDRRMLMLTATKTGNALVDRLHESRLTHMRHILERLSDSELETLASAISIMARAAQVTDGEEKS